MKLNDEINGYQIVGISKDHILTLKGGKYKTFPPDAKELQLHEATRDGDGDGFINDGKPNERKVAPKKKATKTAKKKVNAKKTKGKT